MKKSIGRACTRLATQALALAVFCTAGANAALQTTTASSSTGTSASAVLDTTTGLTWLTPTATTGLTFAQVSTGSWAQSGFRHATSAEFLTLIANSGIDLAAGTTTPLPYLSVNFSGDQAQAVRDLIGALGATLIVAPPSDQNPFGQQNIYAVLADHGSRGVGTAPGNSEVYLSGFSAGAVVQMVDYSWPEGAADNAYGHLLVSAPVPEPAAWALLLLGGVVVGGARLRSRRS